MVLMYDLAGTIFDLNCNNVTELNATYSIIEWYRVHTYTQVGIWYTANTILIICWNFCPLISFGDYRIWLIITYDVRLLIEPSFKRNNFRYFKPMNRRFLFEPKLKQISLLNAKWISCNIRIIRIIRHEDAKRFDDENGFHTEKIELVWSLEFGLRYIFLFRTIRSKKKTIFR